MAEPLTPNRGYTIPNSGDLVNAWGPVLNSNFALLDNLQGSTTALVVSSGAYTLNSSQANALRISLTGTLSGNVSITIPQRPAYYYFHDLTTRGGYTITVTTGATGQRTQNLPSRLAHVFTDGGNVYLVSEPLLGETKALSGPTPPPLWQLAYGQAISRTTYTDLFAFMGTMYGAGDGSTTFNLPDYRGRTIFGQDDMGGTAAGRITSASGFGAGIYKAGGNELMQVHAHGVTDPGHNHTINDPGHTHGVNDPGHAHGVYDPGHNHGQSPHGHGISDPGHSHGVNDPGHTHFTTVPAYWSGRVTGGTNFGAYTGPGNNNIGTSASGTGISIQGSGTGVSVDAAYANINAATTGIGIYASGTGISNQASKTGIYNSASGTGISIQNSGSGGSQNMPPAATSPIIIYCGQ